LTSCEFVIRDAAAKRAKPLKQFCGDFNFHPDPRADVGYIPILCVTFSAAEYINTNIVSYVTPK
jgi:hypothetical protein